MGIYIQITLGLTSSLDNRFNIPFFNKWDINVFDEPEEQVATFKVKV